MKRIQVQDLAIRCRSSVPVAIKYVQGSDRLMYYRSLAAVDGTDVTAEVLRFYIGDKFLTLEVKPYGKKQEDRQYITGS